VLSVADNSLAVSAIDAGLLNSLRISLGCDIGTGGGPT